VTGEVLRFADVESIQDLGTYVARARHLDADGAVRLVASGEVLAAWVRVLPGQGLLGQGLVLGLRVMPLDGPHELDTTVPLAGITDRLARRAAEARVDTELPVPPTTVAAQWTALTPPRSGWEVVAEADPDLLVEVARQGIAAVAQGTPAGAGAAAVATLRSRIWGADLPGAPAGTPAGVAFAAFSLGFVRQGEPAVVRRHGPWTRLSTTVGHVLAR
jgi:hypothetical protein